MVERTEVVQVNIPAKKFYELLEKVDLLIVRSDNQKKTEMLPDYMEVEYVATHVLKISTAAVRRLVAGGKLNPEPRERKCKIKISREEVTRYLNKLSVKKLKKESQV